MARVVRATLKGWTYALEHQDEIIDLILAKYNTQKRTRAHLEFEAQQTEHMVNPRFFEIGHIEPSRYQKIAGIYTQLALADTFQVDESFYLKQRKSQIALTPEEQEWLKDHPVISVGIEEWFPFVRTEKDGTPGGIAADFLSLVLKKTGQKIEVIRGEWSTLLTDFEHGKIDLLPATYYTDERATYGLYSSSYFSAKEFLYLKQGNDAVRSFDDLDGQKLAIVEGYGTIPKIREKFPGIEIVETKNQLASIYAVLNGEADALYESQIVIDELVRSELITGLTAIGQTDFNASPLYFFSRIDEPLLQSILTKALDDISEEERRELISKWIVSQSDVGGQLVLPERAAFNQANFIIQYIAIIFAVLLAIGIAIWFARGRPKQLTIREILVVVFFIFAGLIVSIGTLVTLLLEGEQEQSKIEVRNEESFNLGLELKQSSDDLTRFARTFAVTGDPVYEKYYQTIVTIRDGKRAHPQTRARSYWDQVVAGNVELDEDGEVYSIEQKMLDLGFAENERNKLSQAKDVSDTLVNLETISMNAVNGRFKDARGAFSVEGKPNLEMARQLLHGKQYHDAKARIMKPIDDFFILLEWRTTSELNQVRQRNEADIRAITILTAITIGFAFFAFFLLKRRIISPLSRLEAGALALKDGDYSNRVDITSEDEVGTLASSFNSMAQRIEERTKEVAEKELQLRLAMDNMPGGMLLLNRDQNFSIFNRQYSELFDLPDDLIAEDRPLLDLIHFQAQRGDYGRGKFVKVVSEVMRLFRDEKHHKYERRLPNGVILDVHLAPTPDGGTVAVATDITERKKSEEEIKDARDKAEAATRSKAAFLAAMSHEIRTPMNGVIGMISLLQEGDLESDQRTMMNTVQDSAFSLLQIINDILDFSKIEAGKMSLEQIPVSIDTVMEGVTETLLPNAAKKNLRMALFIDPDIPDHVMTDQVRLRQVLFNLAGNATKFTENTPERQGVVTLRAELAEPVNDDLARIRFSVTDNGIGMNAEAVDKLFTPFAQADETTTRRFGGTGLGLSICKTLTDLMGGEINVESTEGEGSAFHVTLPFDVAEQAKGRSRTFDLSGLNIVYAMKCDDTAEAVERYAVAGGARVTRVTAADIIANVKDQVESDPVDIIVLGSLDDGQDREEVIKTLRADKDIPGPRFVVLTDDRSERSGMFPPDKVVVKCAPVRKSGFMHGVAMAAGRASPEVDNEAPKLSADARKAPTVEEAREAGELILVAEDNVTNQDVIRRQLNVLGYACEIADDGAIAFDMLKDGNYGMLLTDCHMPNMDGYELAGALRDLEQDVDTRLPVVAITANALQGEADNCLAAGMDDYLAKPLEMDKLKAMLAKWLHVDHVGGSAAVTQVEAETKATPVEETPATNVVVNVKVLTDMFGEDMDLLKEILGDYVQPSSDIIAEIDTGFEAQDADAVAKAGHKLKSSSRAIGADALADLCSELESAGKNGNWDEIKKLYPDLHPTFDAVVTFIEEL